MGAISNEKELGRVLKSVPYTIVVTGDLVDNVKTILEPSSTVWKGIIAALATALIAGTGVGTLFLFTATLPLLAISGGVGAIVLTALGAKGSVSAIKIAQGGGGIDVLNTLRSYSIAKSDDDSMLTLVKK